MILLRDLGDGPRSLRRTAPCIRVPRCQRSAPRATPRRGHGARSWRRCAVPLRRFDRPSAPLASAFHLLEAERQDAVGEPRHSTNFFARQGDDRSGSRCSRWWPGYVSVRVRRERASSQSQALAGFSNASMPTPTTKDRCVTNPILLSCRVPGGLSAYRIPLLLMRLPAPAPRTVARSCSRTGGTSTNPGTEDQGLRRSRPGCSP